MTLHWCSYCAHRAFLTPARRDLHARMKHRKILATIAAERAKWAANTNHSTVTRPLGDFWDMGGNEAPEAEG